MNILIIDAFPSNFIDQLSQMPVTYTFIPEADRAEVLEKIPEAEILILNSKIRVTKEVVDMAPKLKMVIRAGVGMDHIDVEYLESKGIIVLNTKGGNADSVGE
ncbi:MAG: 3-phosphoglycerate dehydrogenase, partial [Bacteroidetes bacterium]|nr:3-phosphoglycerate dehydrogenase [Bacteroidota bacterium]